MASIISSPAQIEIQGHRGARGLAPENSLPGFLRAVDLGVQTLEMDVVISKDRQVVVSHDHYLNPTICLDPDGNSIKKGDRSFNLYKLDYAEIKKCDCGSLGHSGYPQQQKQKVYKPLLSEVIAQVEKHAAQSQKSIKYNIELKAAPSGDDLYHPKPGEFTDLVQSAIKDLPIERIIIQSFDPRILVEWRRKFPEYILAYLISNPKSWQENIKELSFTPQIYSPNYRWISTNSVRELHDAGLKVIPWTVNNREDMMKCIEMNVDGLITDYPDVALNLLAEIKKK